MICPELATCEFRGHSSLQCWSRIQNLRPNEGLLAFLGSSVRSSEAEAVDMMQRLLGPSRNMTHSAVCIPSLEFGARLNHVLPRKGSPSDDGADF